MTQPIHHPLIEEFSMHRDKIHDLKLHSAHFRRLAHDYEDVDKAIVRAEQGIEIVNDEYLEEIKKQRLHIKDQIFQLLQD